MDGATHTHTHCAGSTGLVSDMRLPVRGAAPAAAAAATSAQHSHALSATSADTRRETLHYSVALAGGSAQRCAGGGASHASRLLSKAASGRSRSSLLSHRSGRSARSARRQSQQRGARTALLSSASSTVLWSRAQWPEPGRGSASAEISDEESTFLSRFGGGSHASHASYASAPGQRGASSHHSRHGNSSHSGAYCSAAAAPAPKGRRERGGGAERPRSQPPWNASTVVAGEPRAQLQGPRSVSAPRTCEPCGASARVHTRGGGATIHSDVHSAPRSVLRTEDADCAALYASSVTCSQPGMSGMSDRSFGGLENVLGLANGAAGPRAQGGGESKAARGGGAQARASPARGGMCRSRSLTADAESRSVAGSSRSRSRLPLTYSREQLAWEHFGGVSDGVPAMHFGGVSDGVSTVRSPGNTPTTEGARGRSPLSRRSRLARRGARRSRRWRGATGSRATSACRATSGRRSRT